MSEANPFEHGHGLVGGRGADRAAKRSSPPLVHPMVLRPYEVEEDIEAARRHLSEGPVEIEIGFGRGHHIRERIRQAPKHRFLAFEVRRMWCQRLAAHLSRESIGNTRILLADARPLLLELIEPSQLHAASVFFPDPWWKKRHHKRRVMSASTLDVLHRLFEPAGRLHFRTDVAPYFGVVQALVREHGGFDLIDPDHAADGRRLPLTHRETKCAEYDQPTYRLCAVKRS